MTEEFWSNYAPPIVAALSAVTLAVVGAVVTDIGPWYRGLKKPSWQPPDWLFGPAWTLIFTLTAISGVLAWWKLPEGRGRTMLIVLFFINGVLNAVWSVLFFQLRRPDWALVELLALWLSIDTLIAFTWSLNDWSAWLLAPYLAWVTFAGVLNATIVRLNGPFKQ